jgi:uncharacterized protein (DUF1697 family)
MTGKLVVLIDDCFGDRSIMTSATTLYISMLRGVNVSGHRKIAMDDLRQVYSSLGFYSVRTYIQSGNVLFNVTIHNDDKNDPQGDHSYHSNSKQSAIAARIKGALKKKFGLSITVIIRSRSDLEKLIENNPFKYHDETKLYATFLHSGVELDNKRNFAVEEAVNAARGKGEEFCISGREVYLYCPNGYGRTRLSNTFFERILKVPATTRNWKTVLALLSLAKDMSTSS